MPRPTPLESGDSYRTPPLRLRPRGPVLGTLAYYPHLVRIVITAGSKAKRGRYDDAAWVASSHDVRRSLECAGCRFQIEGLDRVRTLAGPAVFVGNHMSTLETFVLPALIQPVRPVTFVIKPTLIDYPVFGHVMRSRNPIVVSRDNPRQDLVTVLEEGAARLARGISVIIFPQTTRTTIFDAAAFNSLGAKLAARAGVPAVPVALRSDAWGNGRLFKDFGAIDPRRPVHVAFGAPIDAASDPKSAHSVIVDFISGRLREWGLPPAAPAV